MTRFIRLLGVLVLLSVVGCRTNRHTSVHSHTQLDSNTENVLWRITDSLSCSNLVEEIEWEWVQINYLPDTLCDTLNHRASFSRLKKTMQITHRQQERVVDSLMTKQSQSILWEEEKEKEVYRYTSFSGGIFAIILILILLLIYKLSRK